MSTSIRLAAVLGATWRRWRRLLMDGMISPRCLERAGPCAHFVSWELGCRSLQRHLSAWLGEAMLEAIAFGSIPARHLRIDVTAMFMPRRRPWHFG